MIDRPCTGASGIGAAVIAGSVGYKTAKMLAAADIARDDVIADFSIGIAARLSDEPLLLSGVGWGVGWLH